MKSIISVIITIIIILVTVTVNSSKYIQNTYMSRIRRVTTYNLDMFM